MSLLSCQWLGQGRGKAHIIGGRRGRGTKKKKTSKRTYETDRQSRSERARTDSYYIIHTGRNQVRSNIVRLKERERERSEAKEWSGIAKSRWVIRGRRYPEHPGSNVRPRRVVRRRRDATTRKEVANLGSRVSGPTLPPKVRPPSVDVHGRAKLLASE